MVGLAFAMPLACSAPPASRPARRCSTRSSASRSPRTIDPINNQQNAVLAQLYSLFATMVFLLTGGDHIMIQGLAASYRCVPLDAVPDIAAARRAVAPLGSARCSWSGSRSPRRW